MSNEDPQHVAKVVAELRRLAVIATDPPEIDGYEAASADYILPKLHRVGIDSNELAQFVALLRQSPWLAAYEGGIANNSPSGQASISLEAIANWLIAQARIHSPDDC